MKLLKIFSLVFALTLCANQVYAHDSVEAWPSSKIKYPIMWKFTNGTPKHQKNTKILVRYVVDFDARGGEYAIINTTTGEYIDTAQIFLNNIINLILVIYLVCLPSRQDFIAEQSKKMRLLLIRKIQKSLIKFPKMR